MNDRISQNAPTGSNDYERHLIDRLRESYGITDPLECGFCGTKYSTEQVRKECEGSHRPMTHQNAPYAL